MPSINVRTVMVASGTSFPLQGNQYEYLPFDAQVEIGINADATGVLATVYAGSDVLMQEGPVPIAAINVFPIYPDSFFLSDLTGAGERLNIQLRDTSAAVRTVMTSVRLTPV